MNADELKQVQKALQAARTARTASKALASTASGLEAARVLVAEALAEIEKQLAALVEEPSTDEESPAGGDSVAAHRTPPPRGGVVDLSLYPGANDTERAIAAYRATVPGAAELDYDSVFELACEAKRVGKFVNLSRGRQ